MEKVIFYNILGGDSIAYRDFLEDVKYSIP
jgi:hypothetical protein